MKTLALVRHAKSSWDHPGIDDHDRPLNERGIRDAPRMAARLAAEHPGLRGAALLSSTALRAATTADAFASALDTTVRLDERLYGATPRRIVELVSRSLRATVLVVAHDPGLSDLARHWSSIPGRRRYPAHADLRRRGVRFRDRRLALTSRHPLRSDGPTTSRAIPTTSFALVDPRFSRPALQSTFVTVPPVMRTSSSNDRGKTVCGVPPAAHSSG